MKEERIRNTVYTIGEALIDFVPAETGCGLKNVTGFMKAAGGAPANVACAVSKLGGRSAFIGKLGLDPFGDFLADTMAAEGVDVSRIRRTAEAGTALAFVSLQADGNREFSFYRNPSADMLLDEGEIEESWFAEGDILHFGSVNLIDAPVKEAHRKAIRFVRERGGIVSFDPNVRLPLWSDPQRCRDAILEFLPLCQLVKISDEELSFITGIEDEEDALQSLFVGDVEHVLYTRGAQGADWVSKTFRIHVPGLNVQAVDTTGAGDAFVGAILYQLQGAGKLGLPDAAAAAEMLRFANKAAGMTTLGRGAIPSLPSYEEVMSPDGAVGIKF
jgi:Sugar kinases, ribokinase family